MADVSKWTYEAAGVSLKAQNRVNAEVARRLKEKGMTAEGLFGGAVDVSKYKGEEDVFITIAGAAAEGIKEETSIESGENMARDAFDHVKGTPIGVVDYFASPKMEGDHVPDFVEGVANACLERKVALLGGESAEMEGTYKEGMFDAFVHVIEKFDDSEAYDNYINIATLIKDMEQPLIVATCDGTGTKTKIIRNPRDVMYHGLNDDAVQGARPIAAALYIVGNAPEDELWNIAEEAGRACDEIGIHFFQPILGRNSVAYREGEVDIAATVLSIVDAKDMIKGEDVKEGDKIIGIGVDGLMTNGYTLARKISEELSPDWHKKLGELNGSTVHAELSKSHVPMTDILFGYPVAPDDVGVLNKYKGHVKAMAHITGGGMEDNIQRMVPEGLCAKVKRKVLPVPIINQWFLNHGLDEDESYSAFNMGVGFTLTVSAEKADEIVDHINLNFMKSKSICDRPAAIIGEIVKSPKFVYE